MKYAVLAPVGAGKPFAELVGSGEVERPVAVVRPVDVVDRREGHPHEEAEVVSLGFQECPDRDVVRDVVSGGAGRATEILQALGRMEVIQPLFVREAAPAQAPSPLQPSRFGGFVGLPRSKFGS